jgi:hypothetical protein
MPKPTPAVNRDGTPIPSTAAAVARWALAARKHGYHVDQHGPGFQAHGSVISVQCPMVPAGWRDRHRITAELSMHSATGLSVPKTLDHAVAEHLAADNTYGDDCGHEHVCPGMRPVVRTA